jgi:hypothetical protein
VRKLKKTMPDKIAIIDVTATTSMSVNPSDLRLTIDGLQFTSGLKYFIQTD